MIDQIFSFSVAAGAAAVNIAPTNFNPIPADGFVELYGVSDFVVGTTALPAVQIVLGGTQPSIPVPGSVIPVNRAAIAAAFVGPDLLNRLLGRTPVRQGTNFQLNISGGTGATVTGRLRAVFMTPDEAAQHPQAIG
jgi:hypothetical protein